jgi:hypothetical protein
VQSDASTKRVGSGKLLLLLLRIFPGHQHGREGVSKTRREQKRHASSHRSEPEGSSRGRGHRCCVAAAVASRFRFASSMTAATALAAAGVR